MNVVCSRLWLWFWHLVPANPILVRVVHGASRRSKHLYLRASYLTALLAVVLFSLTASMSGQNGSLAELAKGASQTFKFASVTQLALMCFLAPVFAAAAITQERDAQTFNILLSTPLTSAQIVFGSLMSRLYFVLVLLVAGLPIFLMTMLYGGVTTKQILVSFALSGATALVTGALAIAIAMFRAGTRRTIFSFYLMIASYLLSLYLLGQWSRTWVEVSPANLDGIKMSWLTPFHPFLTLDVALDRVHAPTYSHLTGVPTFIRYALAFPSAAYVLWTTMFAFLLTLASVFFVRRGAKAGEPTLVGALVDRFCKKGRGRLTRPPRTVWRNPIAWREAKTHSGTGVLLHWAIILGGLLGAVVPLYKHLTGAMTADAVRPWIAGLILIQLAVALIVATNTAATSMTKEKELKTMDLLLATPLTSKYLLWGKLRGLVGLTMPLLLGPVCMLLIFGVFGTTRSKAVPAVWVEVALEVGVLLLIYTACACVIGLRISLVARKNVTAVMGSVGLVVLLYGGATALGLALVENAGGEFGAFFAPFAPFTAVWYLIDPLPLFDSAKELGQHSGVWRLSVLAGSTAAIALYSLIVWSVYSGLVRNFDMIVRKQSGL